ncbi:hypothetical protein FACS189454_05060 [Planctomycetales bacterium]|nr:hypothetical protein FACS189454_05060 [Planctomycetales bacterium]
MNVVCVSLDGLHSGMLGAFGNAWIQTPTLNSLAAQSVLFDRYYAETLDLQQTFERYADGLTGGEPNDASNGSQPVAEWQRKIFITDDSDIFLHPFADVFDERHRLARFGGTKPAAALEETQFFKTFAVATDILDSVKIGDESFFLWLHLEAFRGNWDFPLQYRELYRDTKDPEAYTGTTLPEKGKRHGSIDPDELQSVMEAYSGGVTVFDDVLAGLVEYVDNLHDTALVILSTRGFSLGEHGRIGANDDLYGENVQLPLMIRFPKKPTHYGEEYRFATYRSQSLLQPQDFFSLISANEIPEEPAAVHQTLHIGKALLTPDWFLTETGELYSKPDDRWETNNVAARCRRIVEELTGVRSN